MRTVLVATILFSFSISISFAGPREEYNAGRYSECIALCQVILKKKPSDTATASIYILALLKLEQYEIARAVYRSTSGEAGYNLGPYASVPPAELPPDWKGTSPLVDINSLQVFKMFEGRRNLQRRIVREMHRFCEREEVTIEVIEHDDETAQGPAQAYHHWKVDPKNANRLIFMISIHRVLSPEEAVASMVFETFNCANRREFEALGSRAETDKLTFVEYFQEANRLECLAARNTREFMLFHLIGAAEIDDFKFEPMTWYIWDWRGMENADKRAQYDPAGLSMWYTNYRNYQRTWSRDDS